MDKLVQKRTTRPHLVLVTGPSGAGRSTAINVFEDLGFETIDNLPLALLPRLLSGQDADRSMALGIDVRNRDFDTGRVLGLLNDIAKAGEFDSTLMYVDCGIETLLRRYSETRRRHPMSPDEAPLQGIEQEKILLEPLRARADVLIDTTDISPHDLKTEIKSSFAESHETGLAVSVQSFSYKRGLPRGIDMVFDCRFLNNPYWDESLRGKTGCDQSVMDFVAADARYGAFFEKILDLTLLLLPAYQQEGKAHFSIGLGCTGGQHRSVAVAEQLAKALAQKDWQVSIRHREMERRRNA